LEDDNKQSRDAPETLTEKNPQTTTIKSNNSKPDWIEPDLDFIRMLNEQTENPFKKCMQCGTCSSTCDLSPDDRPFPSKEMAWAGWGLKDRLMNDPDVWLCHQCNDCSTRCPRGARPGDVLAAVRQASVIHWAYPNFLGRWANEPSAILILFSLPIILLSIAMALKDPIEKALGINHAAGEKIIFAYSNIFPHWLLISFFSLISLIVILVMVIGVKRFWNAIHQFSEKTGSVTPVKNISASFFATIKNVITHNNFSKCTDESPRFWSHLLVFFGFLALCIVTFWIITARINPLLAKNFIYPFSFLSPWKVLANIGGASLLLGLVLMMWDRLFKNENANSGSYFDWVFIGTLFLVVITGFVTEVLHYVRLEPHRHLIYFAHLVFVLALILYLPYSKFAHMVYRATAMVFAEYTGRKAREKGQYDGSA